MRKPTENGLASRNTPRRCSMAKVSRALWPSASTSCSQSICSPLASVRPRSAPASMCRSVTCCSKRMVPPSASISARIFSIMLTSRKVPMCGLLTYRISSGAPALTNSVSTLRVRWRGSEIWLQSLPSLKVPAPPSPNCTLLVGSSTLRRHRPQVSCVRRRTSLPRSSTSGSRPIWARISAANSPQGPKPTTTGRSRPSREPGAAWPTNR